MGARAGADVCWVLLTRACTHKSPSRVRFRANRTLSQRGRMTEFEDKADVAKMDKWSD